MRDIALICFVSAFLGAASFHILAGLCAFVTWKIKVFKFRRHMKRRLPEIERNWKTFSLDEYRDRKANQWE